MNKVIALCRAMLLYAKNHCKLQSKLVAAEPYLCEIGIPDVFSLFDTRDNMVTQWFLATFKAGVGDGSINLEIVNNECNFRVLAISYRGFYNRIAVISADNTMRKYYGPDQLIADYLKQVYLIMTQQKV